jgi:preprotein translocase subunit SecD
MIAIYGVLGIIANIALILNFILIIAFMSILEFTLTLPGIAGIILTLGMSIDANVLVFERIKEEIRNNVSKRVSIIQGYKKAFSTVLDANITTLIVGLVLFIFSSGPVKGFAITLSIGIITSIFTAIFCTQAIIYCIYGSKKNSWIFLGFKCKN